MAGRGLLDFGQLLAQRRDVALMVRGAVLRLLQRRLGGGELHLQSCRYLRMFQSLLAFPPLCLSQPVPKALCGLVGPRSRLALPVDL